MPLSRGESHDLFYRVLLGTYPFGQKQKKKVLDLTSWEVVLVCDWKDQTIQKSCNATGTTVRGAEENDVTASP